MPTSCCVPSCKKRRKPGDSSIYFHRFPNDSVMREKWLLAIGRKNLTAEETRYKVVCSAHFPTSMYLERPGTYKPRLKPDAVPTVLKFAQNEPVQRARRRNREPLSLALKRWGRKRNLEDPPYYPTKVIKREKSSPPLENGNDCSTPLVPRRSGRPRKILIKKDPWESPETVVANARSTEKKNILSHEKIALKNAHDTMTDMLKHLHENFLISHDSFSILEQHFADVPMHLFQLPNSKEYHLNERAKEFALSLYYHSPKAYQYVRKRLKLPCGKRLMMLNFSKNFEAGFSLEAFENLQIIVQKQSWKTDCLLLIDFIPVTKNCTWEEKSQRFLGYVNYGPCILEAEEQMASEALVFFLLGLNGNWQLPVAYFLVNRVNLVVLSRLIKTCLAKTADVECRILSVILEGPLNYKKVIKMLGCSLVSTVENKHKIMNSFKHPTRDYQVYVTFDCHFMAQLVRNVWCESKLFMYEKEKIEWKYINKLCQLLYSSASFNCGVLASRAWYTHKLNVKLSHQVFSTQVADAIDWLRDREKHPYFKNSQATTKFLRRMATMLSMSNVFAETEPGCMPKDLRNNFLSFTKDFIGYLVKLQTCDGKMFLKHKRKQFILGLIVTSNSLAAICSSVLRIQRCLSLYSLHVFFNYLKGPSNSNPYSSLIKDRWKMFFNLNGCISFEDFNTISVTRCMRQSTRIGPWRENIFISEFEKNIMEAMISFLHELKSPYKTSVLHYIAGYISKVLLGKLTCQVCSSLLIKNTVSMISLDDSGYANYKLFTSYGKERKLGGLIMASDDTVLLIILAEKYFRAIVCRGEWKMASMQSLKLSIIVAVLSNFVNENCVPYDSHWELCPNLYEPSHSLQLAKMVLEQYLTLRFRISLRIH